MKTTAIAIAACAIAAAPASADTINVPCWKDEIGRIKASGPLPAKFDRCYSVHRGRWNGVVQFDVLAIAGSAPDNVCTIRVHCGMTDR